MTVVRLISDKLKNLVANLGTERDKASGTFYTDPCTTDEQLSAMFRSAWLPKKIVTIPPQDACRRWRNWQADAEQISKLEAEETRLGIKGKVIEAWIKGRLYGGAAIFIGTGDSDPSQPLNPETVKAGGIKYLTVMTRRVLKAAELDTDPMSQTYNLPRFYTVSGNGAHANIHPSRLIRFVGTPHPEPELNAGLAFGWGDSILHACIDAVKNADASGANIASLLFEAKVDVIKIPNFMDGMADPEYRRLVLERLTLAATAKGINGALLLDAAEEYQQKSASFATLPDVLMAFLQIASGAADIPTTRLLGQSPGGLQASGDSDLRNYYDSVSSMQELILTPALSVFDECLIRSALGSRPPEVFYGWAPLWQPTAKERADIGKTTAETIKILAETKLIPEEALSATAVNMLTESGVAPGLEAAVQEFGEELPDEEEEGARMTQDALPRPLYVNRKVLNADDIREWARAQGFDSVLDDLHVTIAFSRDPVDWMKAGETWSQRSDGTLEIAPGGARLIEKLGEGAIALLFSSAELSYRHMQIREAGASWDWPEYQPHITVTYAPGDVDLSKVQPYRGRILLGPEIFEELDLDWKSKVSEG
ncbi:MAG: anti-CBASS protein Acb1 family protein [Sinimarinibacterium flocculans]|uniref:anti-CBASS protein Acb1 family protein n=1 Tax=Sinimarinibacterium flocculans TaxID=985250 RepID=UPI003C3CB7FA